METAALYTRVATNTTREVMSPLDRLTPLRLKEDEIKNETKQQQTNNDTTVEPPASPAALLERPRLEVANIFRRHGSAWRQANAGHVSLGQLK